MNQKTRTYHELITIIGVVNTYVTWNLWNEVLIIVSQTGVGEALPAIFGLFVGILIQVTLIGLTGIFAASNKTLLVIFAIWAVPLLQHNQFILAGLMWAVLYFVSSFLVTWGIRRQTELFIKPFFIKVIPGQVKLWFFLFSIILSGSLILHPAVQQSNISIEIPSGVWDHIWGLIDIEYQTSTPSVSQVQGAQDVTAQGAQNENISIDSLKNLLKEYGLLSEDDPTIPEGSESFDASTYIDDFEQGLSQNIKENTEDLANNFFAPIRDYLPYLIGLSFFISAQIVTPILGYLAFALVEGVLFVMRKTHMVTLEEKETTIERYVLQ